MDNLIEEEVDRHPQRFAPRDLGIKTEPALLRIYRHQKKWNPKVVGTDKSGPRGKQESQ